MHLWWLSLWMSPLFSSIFPLCHIWHLCPHLECHLPCVRRSALVSILWLLVTLVGWYSSRQYHLSLPWWLHLCFQILNGKEAEGSALGPLLQLSPQLDPVLPANTSSNVMAPMQANPAPSSPGSSLTFRCLLVCLLKTQNTHHTVTAAWS